MKVKILGNGGAISNGLPYNSFIIDDKVLVETPPDIMNSLGRENIPVESIESIYISHMHGDHTFGFPFLALRIFYECRRTNREQSLTIYIPEGGRDYLKVLIEAALSKNHPCVEWMMNNTEFICISEHREFEVLQYKFRLYKMEHPLETYGFVAYENERAAFAYTADTLWCGSVEDIIGTGPDAVLLDLNGEPDDPIPVHMREKDIIEKGIPILKPNTTLYGTHLKSNKTGPNERIKYPLPGTVIVIE